MSKKENEVSVEKETTKKATEQKFPLQTLRDNCVKLFGVSSSTFAGATYALDKAGTYTVSEVKKVLIEWLGKGVK